MANESSSTLVADGEERVLADSLLHELSSWAERHGVHRLEPTVMAHDNPAIALYEAAGYEHVPIPRPLASCRTPMATCAE